MKYKIPITIFLMILTLTLLSACGGPKRGTQEYVKQQRSKHIKKFVHQGLNDDKRQATKDDACVPGRRCIQYYYYPDLFIYHEFPYGDYFYKQKGLFGKWWSTKRKPYIPKNTRKVIIETFYHWPPHLNAKHRRMYPPRK